MSRQKLLVFFGIPAFLILLVSAYYVIDRVASSKLGFYVWRLVSGRAHGGEYAKINGIRIYYETYGSGQPVLILHGGLGRLEDMQRQIRALAETRFVVAADSRGHGRSTDGDEPLSYTLMADDMITLLDILGVDKVDVVGWSDGGIIGLDLAMRFPDRIRRLVAIGSNYDVDGLMTKPDPTAVPTRRHSFLQEGEPDFAHWLALYHKVLAMWLTQPRYSLEDLSKIKSPTLVIAGEYDTIKRSHTDQLAKAIPGAQEVIIAGASHNVLHDASESLNSQILRFIADRI